MDRNNAGKLANKPSIFTCWIQKLRSWRSIFAPALSGSTDGLSEQTMSTLECTKFPICIRSDLNATCT